MRDVGGDFGQHKFLHQIENCTATNANRGIFESESGATIAGRIIEIGDASGCQTPEDAGIIRLPVAVVAFTNHGIRQSVKDSGFCGTCALVKITRVLFEKSWEHCVARICKPQPMLSPERFFA